MNRRDMKVILKELIGDYIARYPQSDFVTAIKYDLEVELLDRRLQRRTSNIRTLRLTDAERRRMESVLGEIAQMLKDGR